MVSQEGDIMATGAGSSALLGQEASVLISVNQKLLHMGITSTLKLPRIAVVGDQSTGKSSLIETISGIKVPKASSLCTRCPIEINMVSGDNPASLWYCQVFIVERYSFDASKAKPTRGRMVEGLGPWCERDPGTIEPKRVGETGDPSELLDLIKEAQKSLLNPLRKPGSPQPEEFSPNIIRLVVSEGIRPNLSFVDLPGVIQNVQKDQKRYHVPLIEELARSYIRNDDFIIMLTLPTNHDVSNSKAFSLIQDEEAESRTVIVFTKVDIASIEDRQHCIDNYLMDAGNHNEVKKHGSYMVMLNSGEHEESSSLQREKDFFSQDPWVTMGDEVRARLGVCTLINRLRIILVEETKKALPSNLEQISDRIVYLNKELQTMPPPPDTAELPWQLREIVNKFEHETVLLFEPKEGDHQGTAFDKLVSALNTFRSVLMNNKPTLKLSTVKEDAALKQIKGNNDGNDEDDVAMTASAPAASTPRQKATHPSNLPRKTEVRRKMFGLEEIRRLNIKHYSRTTLPGEIAPLAIHAMNQEAVHFWEVERSELISVVKRLILNNVNKYFCQVFDRQSHLPLFAFVQTKIKDFIEERVAEEENKLYQLCSRELENPFTCDGKGLKYFEDESLDDHRERRSTLRQTIAQGKTNKSSNKKTPNIILDADDYDLEVRMYARTQAYYEVASRRFVDNVQAQIRFDLIPKLARPLLQDLWKHLGLDDMRANHDKIVVLMSENGEREQMRQRLTKERERLEAGREYIDRILDSIAVTANRTVPLNHSLAASPTTTPDVDMLSPNIDLDLPLAPQRKLVDTPSSKRKVLGDLNEQRPDDESPTKRTRTSRLAQDVAATKATGLASRPRPSQLDEEVFE